MKRRVVKKQMRRILNSELPVMFKLSAMHEMIKASQKSGLFQFKNLYSLNFDRFSTSDLHKGYVTVSEHDRIDEIGFSNWHKAMTWICKQAKVCGSEYVVDSGHYRYRVYFSGNQE
jgi:hypothetical protein